MARNNYGEITIYDEDINIEVDGSTNEIPEEKLWNKLNLSKIKKAKDIQSLKRISLCFYASSSVVKCQLEPVWDDDNARLLLYGYFVASDLVTYYMVISHAGSGTELDPFITEAVAQPIVSE